jgi:hypothetical protein
MRPHTDTDTRLILLVQLQLEIIFLNVLTLTEARIYFINLVLLLLSLPKEQKQKQKANNHNIHPLLQPTTCYNNYNNTHILDLPFTLYTYTHHPFRHLTEEQNNANNSPPSNNDTTSKKTTDITTHFVGDTEIIDIIDIVRLSAMMTVSLTMACVLLAETPSGSCVN